MKVSEQDVEYVAELAHLELSLEERRRMVRDLNSILEHIDMLRELETADVPPMAQTSDCFGADPALAGSARFAYALRADVATPASGAPPPNADDYARAKRPLECEQALANAPEHDAAFFKVPKVIER